MQTMQLNKTKDDRQGFDCGVAALNNYLKVMANQQAAKDNVRTFVLEDPADSQKIMGYFSLTITPVDLALLPEKLQKKHGNSLSAGLIARLAVDKKYTKQGIGSRLLVDALMKLLQASEVVAFPLVVVDAKEGAAEFYHSFGFTPFIDSPHKLFMTMTNIRANFGQSPQNQTMPTP